MRTVFSMLLLSMLVQFSYGQDRLLPGEVLLADQRITSSNGKYSLVMQYDGNLAIYTNGGQALWHTNTHLVPSLQNGGGWVALQGDGNFVLYDQQNRAFWNTKTAGVVPGQLVMQSDGNLVLYNSSGAAVWASNTKQLVCTTQYKEAWGGNRDHFGTFNTTQFVEDNCKVKVPWLYERKSYQATGTFFVNGSSQYGYCYVRNPIYIGVVAVQVCQ